MRRAFVVVLLALVAFAAADHVRTGIRFPGWRIETPEDIYLRKGPVEYPIQNLIDGRPDTAWVYRGPDYPEAAMADGVRYYGFYYVTFTPEAPVELDELRIQNGYNKSERLYRLNTRATQIQIYEAEGDFNGVWQNPVRTVDLSDKLGTKSIRLPRRKYRVLTIRFSGLTKGRVDDLAISEIDLRSGGKSVLAKPKVFTSTKGDECGCGGESILQNAKGRTIARISGENSYGSSFNSRGDLYAGVDRQSVWVADLRTQRVIRRRRFPESVWPTIQWLDARKLRIDVGANKHIPPMVVWRL